MTTLLTGLNEPQQQAVTLPGPLLCLAGPGAGKTRVLTHRIAYLLEQGEQPEGILALTFTNKAAHEMKERLTDMVSAAAKDVLLCTFHSWGARFLRRWCGMAGLKSDFKIFDENDSEKAIRFALQPALKAVEDRTKPYTPASDTERDFLMLARRMAPRGNTDDLPKRDEIARAIRRWKSQAYTVRDALTEVQQGMEEEQYMALAYALSEEYMRENNAVDFADLLMWPYLLLANNRQVQAWAQAQWPSILCDEFQDTDPLQWDILKLLDAQHRNLFVVGDNDQTLYTWRGAQERMLNWFLEHYEEAQTVRLEQNYRSTPEIVSLGMRLIQHDHVRIPKSIFTTNQAGIAPVFTRYPNDLAEADGVAATILNLAQQGYRYQDMAIIYRKNRQSQAFEKAFREHSIPFKVIGEMPFLKRKEVVDLLSYIRIALNPEDLIALRRVLADSTLIPFGIGTTSIDRIMEAARQSEQTLFEALIGVATGALKIPRLGEKSRASIEQWLTASMDFPISDLPLDERIEELIDALGLEESIQKAAKGEEEVMQRLGNLRQLVRIAGAFREHPVEEQAAVFLEELALSSEIPGERESTVNDAVGLMTGHKAKGLEFPVVFLVGLVDGVLPICDEERNPAGYREERRICYVMVTRAKERLYVSSYRRAFVYGDWEDVDPSPFEDELGLSE